MGDASSGTVVAMTETVLGSAPLSLSRPDGGTLGRVLARARSGGQALAPAAARLAQ
jgi:hypothetical protein